jgi:hypothetical protein
MNVTIQLQNMDPCISNESFKRENCRYRTYLRDYTISNEGTIKEEVFIDIDKMNAHQKKYSEWSYLENLKERRAWRPCEYYHQLNIALASSHAILNYPLFLLPTKPCRILIIFCASMSIRSIIIFSIIYIIPVRLNPSFSSSLG